MPMSEKHLEELVGYRIEVPKLRARVAELQHLADQEAAAADEFLRVVEERDRYREALEDIIAIEECRNRGDAESATRAREALNR